MSYFTWDRMAGRSQMEYLNANYGRYARMTVPALNQLDRVSTLRDDLYAPLSYRPYTGGADPYVRPEYNRHVDDLVSAARSASSAQQPVYETRAGYRNFDRFDERPVQRAGLRRAQQQPAAGQKKQQAQPQQRLALRSSNQDQKPVKILKRPAPAPKAPNQQSLSDYLKQMGSDEPVIGLKYVTEFTNSTNKTFSYKCELCNFSGNASQTGDHITSAKHRKNYIKDNKLEEVADKDLAKRAAAIETVHGRGEWSVSQEDVGFVRMDKSKFFKKVKRSQDVDMQDMTGDEEKSDGSGLKKGDVVVDELVIDDDDDETNETDPESNPKFFVLKQIDKLLDDNFAIANESEAMVVDSIIRKLDRALAQFVELANAEAGVDDIQLLDKDDSVTMDEPAAAAADSEKAEPVVAAAASTAEAVAETPAASEADQAIAELTA